jgi:hypothetical protein
MFGEALLGLAIVRGLADVSVAASFGEALDGPSYAPFIRTLEFGTRHLRPDVTGFCTNLSFRYGLANACRKKWIGRSRSSAERPAARA